MLAEQFTSMSDNTQGEWETREVYVADERLNPRESLAVARHSAHGFGWGDGRSGAVQLAFSLLLGATETASAVAHYQAFKWEGMLGTQAGRCRAWRRQGAVRLAGMEQSPGSGHLAGADIAVALRSISRHIPWA